MRKPRQAFLARLGEQLGLDLALAAKAGAAGAQYSFLGSCMLRTRL